jgi:hypothetical protein
MLKNAEKTNRAKLTDLVKGDASPTELVAAANGLILGPTRQGVLGAAGQMTARNEVADLIPHDKSGVPVVGNKKYEGNITKMPITGQELYSYEARDELKKNPNINREEGLPGLYNFAKEVPSMVSEISQEVSKDPGVLKNLVPEGVLGAMGVDPEDFYVYEEEPMVDDKGNFTEKPKFMDYLKSLPGAYADKVSRDEDFAKKMIAGFLNMMRPVEGFVPVNSAVAFGDAYLGEETRQANMLPADAKMLEYFNAYHYFC